MLVFKLPFSDKIFTVDESSPAKSVCFYSFDQSQETNFEGNIIETSLEKFLEKEIFTAHLEPHLKNFHEESKDEYTRKLKEIITFIKENQLPKLVISRIKLLVYDDITSTKKINLSRTFLNLCKSYPNAFAYFFVKEGKCWMGAFSELLGKFNKKTCQFETMSLAGTLPVQESWTEKELEEQKPVSAYIKNILRNFSEDVEESETHDHISGNIKHLRTDFRTKIAPKNLEKIIAELHPTPAVCGIPKDFCKEAIEKFEKFDRNLYAGYIKVETEDEVQYFVNLRCAEFRKNVALIYVGGGITALSSPEKEWRETELKSEAILKNIAF